MIICIIIWGFNFQMLQLIIFLVISYNFITCDCTFISVTILDDGMLFGMFISLIEILPLVFLIPPMIFVCLVLPLKTHVQGLVAYV